MNVAVETLDRVRKKVEVTIPEEKVTELRETIYGELKRQAKIKGFRPGKVPRSIITTYYKEYIDDELKKRMVQETMQDALLEAKIDPITEPAIDFIEEDGRSGYTLECEVIPEIELPSYAGIEVEVESINVSDEDVDKRIDGLQHMHAEMVPRVGDAKAQTGDFVVVKYQGYMNGKPVKGVGTEAYPLELGSTTLMPEFENALIGLGIGEERDVEITFPDDYPDKSIATKTIQFKVEIREIREKRLPEINDEFAKDLSFENMASLREGMAEEIRKEKETGRKRAVAQSIMDTLIKDTDIPVPKRLLEKRVTMMIGDTMARFKPDRLTAEEERNLEGNMRNEFAPRAEERIKGEMILAKIAEKEGIKVDDDDVSERMKKMAEDSRRSYAEVEKFYREYNLMDSLRSSVVEEKAIDFLRENAVIKEKA
ncbi:trigger factor [Syntrophorhabdus aromaticivorans]|uniref:Trigger factor n=1 Tax=Syntrophorhabdus aromaticivorans TaxID=328301 RepID=A0A971M2R9_9BACT|nr:trigger factor [Syntrophorhabdus aromaticivorans]NLW34780.1 trigger factor [Syntrophorhabdus aromaticivorans]